MEIQKSDIVLSTAGHDQGKLFFVMETDGAYVLIADGKTRPLERMKRKKRKHVRKVPRAESRVAGKIRSGEKVLNSELRRNLAVCSQEIISQNQGRF